MKYINGMVGLFIVSLATGCGGGSADGSNEQAKNTAPVTLTAPASTNQGTNPAITTPATNPVTSTNPVTVSSKTGTSTTATTATPSVAGVNPEHGKPGHRCDINVGAPLDSKPNQASTTPSAQPVITASKPVSTPTSNPIVVSNQTMAAGATGLNPEHGKPGHRCDIPVGLPLDNKAAATPANTQPVVNTQAVIPSKIPVINTSPVTPATTTTTGAGLNPEHGKPGHRCDISVGAPLDSKPKQ